MYKVGDKVWSVRYQQWFTIEYIGMYMNMKDEKGYWRCDGRLTGSDTMIDLHFEEIIIPTPSRPRWRANYHDMYHYVTRTMRIAENIECNVESDDELFKAHNYFKTREQAKAYRDKMKQILFS